MDASGGDAGDQVSLFSSNSDSGIHKHFQKESGIITFWSTEFRVPLKVQSEVIPPVQMRRRNTAFSRVSTGESDIPSSCEMKDEPEFKPLQGNPAFFWVGASRGPFLLRQKTHEPSNIPIAEGKLHLRGLWKVGSPLQSKKGNQLSSWNDMVHMELSSSFCTDLKFI